MWQLGVLDWLIKVGRPHDWKALHSQFSIRFPKKITRFTNWEQQPLHLKGSGDGKEQVRKRKSLGIDGFASYYTGWCSGYITGKLRQRPSACVACRCSQGMTTVNSMYIMGRTTFCKETSLQKASEPGQTRVRFLPYSLWLLRNTCSSLSSPVDSFALQVSSALILRLSFRTARLLGNVSHDVWICLNLLQKT